MLQLKNATPFAAAFSLFRNEQGIDTLYTMVKSTFNIGPQWTLHNQQQPLQETDVFWGDPQSSSLRHASDYHLGKSATDIIMLGSACAPDQRAVQQMDVSLRVGTVGKTIRVFGDRYWRQGQISYPEPFTHMPLVYERAFGGVDERSGQVRGAESRNPVGRGYVGRKSRSEVEGMALPNLECPSQLIRDLDDMPAPACFAPVAGHWQPRSSMAGTYDDAWQQTRAPYLPEDYQQRFMNVAHPDLIYPGFLKGGEEVNIQGMHPSGNLNFLLPQIKLTNRITLDDQSHSSQFALETLLLEPNQLSLSMVWRAAMPCDKKMLKIKQIFISLSR